MVRMNTGSAKTAVDGSNHANAFANPVTVMTHEKSHSPSIRDADWCTMDIHGDVHI